LKWFDKRITFKNLKISPADNLLDMMDIHKIWTPQVIIENSLDKHRIMAGEGKSWSMMVLRLGNRTLAPLAEIDEDYLYSGSENSFMFTTFTTVTMKCDFDLKMYPFDIQKCPIQIGVPEDYFEAYTIQLNMAPKVDNGLLLQYEYLDEEHTALKEPMKSIEIKLRLRRLFSYHITNTYIPTKCLMIIAQLTLFIDPGHFEANIMVALTAMLVMYTLFQSVSANLPQTSYLKMIDVWLFCGLILPFFLICILVVLDAMITKEKDEIILLTSKSKKKGWTSQSLLKITKLAFPTFNVVFCFIYWSYAFYNYYKL